MEIIKREKSIEEVNQMSPLTWAYIGDNVFELYVRTNLVNTTKLKPHELHIKSIKYVKAQAQAEFLNKIEENLTDEEKEIVRRGRNTQNHHKAKNATFQEYMYATAFEALLGYLYLTKQDQRLNQILNIIFKDIF
ncbi:MAG: Mini-ribonuclease 3 [Clostridia bacterium]